MAYENKWIITHYHPWYTQNWKGLTSFNGDNIWTDGTNLYHSQGSTQYVLDRTTNTWTPKTWNGLTSFYGTDIWSDGNDVYISRLSDQYVLDKTTDTWITKTWANVSTNEFNGYNVWTDGTDIYYSQGGSQWILNKTTGEWDTISWPYSFSGRDVWTDGTNLYYSDTSIVGWHGIFDKTTKTWNEQTWSGLTSFDGYRVWTDGVDTYYSNNNINYILDKENNTWNPKTWSTPVIIDGLYIWHDGNKTYNSYGFRQYELGDSVTLIPSRQSYPKLIETKSFTSKWVSDTIASGWTSTFKAMDLAWPDMNSSEFIWTDGSNYYYSLNDDQYVFDADSETWSTKTWIGLSSFRGNRVWHHNGHIYYSYESDQYELNLFTGEWVVKTWNNHVPENGNCVWHHNNTAYYGELTSTTQWRLDDSTDTWEDITWDSSSDTKTISGDDVWTDGVDTLFSRGAVSKKWVAYVFNESSLKWTKKTYSGQVSSLYGLYGRNIWHHDGKIHFDYRYNWTAISNCFLNSSRNGWLPITWINGNNGAQMTPGSSVMFVCGDSCYWIKTSDSSYGPYKLQKSVSSKLPRRESYPELIETKVIPDEWLGDRVSITNTWAQKTWSGGASSSYGYNVWTDGENIYYSSGSNQYVLDKTTSTWSTKTWTGLTSFNGINVWTDGENIYYSYDGTNYVLDKTTSTWSTKSWSGLNYGSFRGQYVWNDGDNIYYSYDNVNKVLNKNTGAWQNKLWNGCAYVNGYNVWKDGDTVYFSGGNDAQFILNKATNTWEPKTWNGISIGSLTGQRIWTDGEDIYFSYGQGSQYILNRDTDTWERASWQSTNISSGTYVWTDGDSTYYSYGTTNLKFNKNITITTPYRFKFTPLQTSIKPRWFIDDDIPYLLDFPELKESVGQMWLISDDIPFRIGFPELKESADAYNTWFISNDIPFRIEYPDLLKSASGPDSWLQDKGWDPRRPWPEHRSIIQKVQTIPNIPDVDWTKSMQQTFEFYTVDPNNWYDDQKLENIISCDLTHDLTSDKRGNASISVTEPLPESYIRTYLVVTQAGYMHKICLGTYLYMTSSDSFDGMKHNITMTGYTPMVELEEKLPPLGFHVIGITNRKHSGDAPMVTEAIKDIVTTYTRCEIENRTVIQKPLLNDFVAGTNDNFLTVINNILNASSLQQYILTVDEWGTIIVKDKPVLEDAIPTYIYTDDNSSILLPSLDTNDDIYGIPNVVEVLYTGDKRLPAIRVIVKNEDPTSIVSIPARGREIAKRFTITNIAAPVNDYSEAAVRAQVTAQAERLLEAASTINKTISYSHGYCDVKVGDTVLINYERAGVTGIRAKVVSQRISCKPGCQVDEQAVYTKKLWNRGV